MVKNEGLKTQIVEDERCQRHHWTHSSWQVSFDEGFLTVGIPQTRTQRPQLRQRYQKHQPPRPPHLPPSRTHSAYFNWSLWTSHRTLLASLSKNFLFRDIKTGRGNSSSDNWLSVRLGWTNVFKQQDALFWHASIISSNNMANRLLHGRFII